MTTRSWIRRLFARKPRTIRKNPVGFRPRLEGLEDRVTPNGLPPTVVTGAAGSLSTSGATVQATVNPNGSSTYARFQYSTDPSFTPSVASTIGPGFNFPNGVAMDAAGDVFVADTGDNAVKEVRTDGSIRTIGSGFNQPFGVAVDGVGDVFVADWGNSAVKEVKPDGSILTLGSGFTLPYGVAVDGVGDVFVTDFYGDVQEVKPDGTMQTIGSGFSGTSGVSVDAAGDVFVADTGNNAVKEVKPDGSIKTIGSGFNKPTGVAVDAAGDVFVADTGNSAVKEILPDHATTLTIASGIGAAGVAVDGSGDVFFSDSDTGAVLEVLPSGILRTLDSGFRSPQGVAVDGTGDAFIADTGHHAIEEVRADSTVLTLASGLNSPAAVAVDGSGDVFVADDGTNAVLEVKPDGTMQTLGSGFSGPQGVAVDGSGDVFVADTGNNAVKEVMSNGTMQTLGSGFVKPTGVAVDGAGDVFVADAGASNYQLVELGLATAAATPAPLTGTTAQAVSAALTGLSPATTYYYRAVAVNAAGTVADWQSPPQSFRTLQLPSVTTGLATAVSKTGATVQATVNPNGSSTTALFQYSTDPSFQPHGTTIASVGAADVAVDAHGDVFVATGNGNSVEEVLPGGTIQTIGSFSNPSGVAVDASGDVFVAENGSDTITEVKPDGSRQTIATGPMSVYRVAVDAAGDVFFSDLGGNAVYKVLPDLTMKAIATGLQSPQGVAVDPAGDVFVTNAFAVCEVLPNGIIRTLGGGGASSVAVDPAGDVFVTHYGLGTAEEILPDGIILPLGSGFNDPSGVAVDGSGDVFVADTFNDRVVELPAATTVAATPSPLTGSTAQGVSAALIGLAPGATYYYRALAISAVGQVIDGQSPPQSFLTPTLPAVTTGAATPVSATGATLAATVTPNSSSTSAFFQYSTDPSFTPTVASTIGSGFSGPYGVAVDAAGDVFVADSGHNAVQEVLTDGTVQTIGSGFNTPYGVAVDAAGDVFVADTNNYAVKEVLPNGTILTIGSGFRSPFGVAVDAAGDVFVADTANNAVKEVLPNGTILTIGSGFNQPLGVAVDGAGDVFVADTGNNAVKEVLPNGTIRTLDSGFSIPEGVAVDGVGDVFVADTGNNAVKEVLPNGTIRTLGSGFVKPTGVAVDAAGDVFVADFRNNRVVELSPPTVAATPAPLSGLTAQGVSGALTGLSPGTTYYYRAIAANALGIVADVQSPQQSFRTLTPPSLTTGAATALSATGAVLEATINPNGSSTSARFQYSTDPSFTPTVASTLGSGFSFPFGVAVDAAGDVFVADTGNNAVEEVLPDGSGVTLGSGFSTPTGVAVDAAGDVFVADYGNNAVKEVLPDGTIVTLGSGFLNPGGVAVDAAGDVFVADTSHNAVKEVRPDGSILTVGSGFSGPSGVAVDASGDVFVADSGHNAIKEVLPNHTILALGSGFNDPSGVAVDGSGNVFVADTFNNAVKVVKTDGTIVTLGSGFSSPQGVAVDAAGDVFIVDELNNRVVELSPPTVAATPAPLTGSLATAVSATLTGLAPGTDYYYRAVASGPGGTVADDSAQSFTTPVATAFADLVGGSIPFGAGSVNLSGQLLTTPGTSFPIGSVVTISIDGVTETAAMSPDGSFQLAYQFSAALHNLPLGVVPSPYAITYAYSDPSAAFAPASDSSQSLSITQATPTVGVADSGGTYNGGAFAATATVAGVVPGVDTTPAAQLEGVTPTLTYYAGYTASGTPLTGAPVLPGTYTVLASFAGSADYTAASATTTFTIQAPSASITGPTTGVPGQPLSYTFAVSGPTQGLTFTISYGDGASFQTSAGVSNIQFNHVYTTTGGFTIQVTATDQTGAVSQFATLPVQISTVALEADPSGTTLAIGGTTGNDQFVVSAGSAGQWTAALNGQALGRFVPAAVMIYSDGGTDKVAIYGTPAADSFTIDPADVVVNGFTIAGDTIADWQLYGLGGNNTYTVHPGSTAQINGGAGGSNTLIGPDTANIWKIAGTDRGLLDDTVAFGNIQNLVGGTGGNIFTFFPNGAVAGSITGGGGTGNLLNYTSYGAAVTVNLQTDTATGVGSFANIQSLVGAGVNDTLIGPDSGSAWFLSGANTGNVDGVAFRSMENLVGGSGMDVFQIAIGAAMSGSINGGGGGDWLDYHLWQTPVSVNLASGVATGVAGGISNIQNVRGGQGGNTLTGDSQGNILVGGVGTNVIQGGSGRSILIGGAGTDQVTGGSADDILIAGSVPYATHGNWDALAAIFAEWQSADPYLTRINTIKNVGVGPANQYKLVWGNTVADNDLAPATLTGGGGTDWFFAKVANGGVLDTITDLNAAVEHVD
jgi:hypothetical protein